MLVCKDAFLLAGSENKTLEILTSFLNPSGENRVGNYTSNSHLVIVV
jgi:hypothetical protein